MKQTIPSSITSPTVNSAGETALDTARRLQHTQCVDLVRLLLQMEMIPCNNSPCSWSLTPRTGNIILIRLQFASFINKFYFLTGHLSLWTRPVFYYILSLKFTFLYGGKEQESPPFKGYIVLYSKIMFCIRIKIFIVCVHVCVLVGACSQWEIQLADPRGVHVGDTFSGILWQWGWSGWKGKFCLITRNVWRFTGVSQWHLNDPSSSCLFGSG